MRCEIIYGSSYTAHIILFLPRRISIVLFTVGGQTNNRTLLITLHKDQLTKESQLEIENLPSSGGTIRYFEPKMLDAPTNNADFPHMAPSETISELSSEGGLLSDNSGKNNHARGFLNINPIHKMCVQYSYL